MAIHSVAKRRKRVSFIILTVVSILWIVPLLWGLATSFKTDIDIATRPTSLFPQPFDLSNYSELFDKPDTPVLRWMGNSLLIATIHTGLYLVVASLAAYAFALLKWKRREKLFWLVLTTTMIPAVINLVPLITMMIDFGWFGSWAALIIPGLGGVFGMFLLRQFFMGIPSELIDAGKIDGLGSFGIFRRIVMPLSKSAFMVTGMFAFLGSWNDYLWPLIVMTPAETAWQTLPVGLSKIASTYNYDYGLSMAAAILSIVPVVIVYMFTQDKIIEGVSRAGIK